MIRVWDNIRKQYIEYEEPKAEDMPVMDAAPPSPTADELKKRIDTLEAELAKVKATAEEASTAAAVAKAAVGVEVK